MGSLSSPKLPAGPTHAHHPAAAEPPKAWPGCPSPSPSQTLHMQVEETGLQWVLDPSSTLFPKRDSSHGQLSAACGQGSPGLGMRRGRAACGPGFRVRACAESAAPAGEAPGLSMRTASSQTQRSEPERGGRPGAAPGRAPFTCEKSPRREEAPPTPTHTRQPPRPPCQRAWLLLPPPRSHPLLPFPAPPVLPKPRVSSSPPPSALPGLQADLSGENHPATHTAPPLVPFSRLPLLSGEKAGVPGLA